MKIYLIRHGETVDNIAGLYAGVRDSQLTNHGVEQAHKLGVFFATHDVIFTHIFASPLTRAYQTAESVQQQQIGHASDKTSVPDVVKVADLIEQDFGYYEGKSFHARSSPRKTGRETHSERQRNDPGFQEVESRESLARRADAFLDQHLMPVICSRQTKTGSIIAIVSHGMLLSTLWRRMLKRMSRGTIVIAPEVTSARGPVVLEHLGGWSNTGYLELELLPRSGLSCDDTEASYTATTAAAVGSTLEAEARPSMKLSFADFFVTILAIDSKTHLTGLKRQRGGIGRLAHDSTQRTLDSFFKRPKLE